MAARPAVMSAQGRSRAQTLLQHKKPSESNGLRAFPQAMDQGRHGCGLAIAAEEKAKVQRFGAAFARRTDHTNLPHMVGSGGGESRPGLSRSVAKSLDPCETIRRPEGQVRPPFRRFARFGGRAGKTR